MTQPVIHRNAAFAVRSSALSFPPERGDGITVLGKAFGISTARPVVVWENGVAVEAFEVTAVDNPDAI